MNYLIIGDTIKLIIDLIKLNNNLLFKKIQHVTIHINSGLGDADQFTFAQPSSLSMVS